MPKKILYSLLLSTLLFPAFSIQAGNIELSEVPQAVIKGIKVAHPDATDVDIDKELHFGLELYEVKFILNGKQHETLFTPQGGHFGHEEELEISDLPNAIIHKLKQIFTKLTILKAEKIKHPDGRIEYEIDVNGDGENWELAMSPAGKVWGKERD